MKVVTTKKLQGDGCTIECIIYESRPGLYVTANLYVPQDTSKPMPGFIIIHSHHNPKTQGELQDMGMIWARQGCLVLVPDMLGHGERRQHTFVDAKSYPEKFAVGRQDYHFRYNVNLQLSLLGESLMGWMVWDLMAASMCSISGRTSTRSTSWSSAPSPAAAIRGGVRGPRAARDGGRPVQLRRPATGDEVSAPRGRGAGVQLHGRRFWESTGAIWTLRRDGFLPWVIVG